MIKLYLNYYQIKAKLKKDVIKEKYYIINNKFIENYKKFYDFSILEKELKENMVISQIVQALENNIINKKKL